MILIGRKHAKANASTLVQMDWITWHSHCHSNRNEVWQELLSCNNLLQTVLSSKKQVQQGINQISAFYLSLHHWGTAASSFSVCHQTRSGRSGENWELSASGLSRFNFLFPFMYNTWDGINSSDCSLSAACIDCQCARHHLLLSYWSELRRYVLQSTYWAYMCVSYRLKLDSPPSWYKDAVQHDRHLHHYIILYSLVYFTQRLV